MPDGRIAVANGGSREIRFYDSEGRFLSSSGRTGGGPGEFRQLNAVFRFHTDSLLAYDSGRPMKGADENIGPERFLILSRDGSYIRSFTLPRLKEGTWAFPAGVFADGSVFIVTTPSYDSPRKTGLTREPLHFFRVGADGQVQDSLGSVAGPDTWVQTFRGASFSAVVVGSIPFSRSPETAVGPDLFYSGEGERFQIAAYTTQGRLERLIRWTRQNRPVTPEDIENWRRGQLAGPQDDNMRRRFEAEFAELPLPIPSQMPAHGSLRLDAEGNLWVQEYRAPGEFHTRWIVFDNVGRLLGVVEGPDRFFAHEIGADYILGTRTDELDVEHVERYRLLKSR